MSGSPTTPPGEDAPSTGTEPEPVEPAEPTPAPEPEPIAETPAPEAAAETEPEPVAPAEPTPTPEAETAPEPVGRPTRYIAGFLSAIVPGLGHLVLGRRLLAAVFLAPTIAVLGGVVILLVTSDRPGLAARLLDPGVLAALLGLQLGILAWRLVALGSSLLIARPPRYGATDILPVALLLAFVVLPQAYVMTVTGVAREAAIEVFQASAVGPVWRPSTPPTPTPVPRALPTGQTPEPPTPSPSPTPAVPRLTVLLIGEDSGVGRNTALTDTMIVASLDPIGKTVSMLSIPRDLVDAPIPGGGTWHPKINGLAAYARSHPDAFPGSNGNGQGVLAGTIGELIGVPIDYWAQVNLGGLIRIVDSVGGVDVTVTHGFCDPGYDEYGQQGFGIPAGRWHLNGSQALAYARVRKALGESDFTRAARQQEVLVGLRDAVVRGGFLNDPIGFLQAIGQTVRTNVPPDLLPEVAKFAEEIGRDRVYRAVVTHPLVRPTSIPDPRGSIQIPDVPGIRALAAGLFSFPGTEPVIAVGAKDTSGSDDIETATGGSKPSTSPAAGIGSSSGSGQSKPAGRAPSAPHLICRAPAAKPTPTPKATPASSPSPSGSGELVPSAEPGPSGEPLPSGEPVPSGESAPSLGPSASSDASPAPASIQTAVPST